jgi:hypothetical protein
MGVVSFNPLEPYSLEIDIRNLSAVSCTIDIKQEREQGRGKKRVTRVIAVRKACFIRHPANPDHVWMIGSGYSLPRDIFNKCREKALHALNPDSGLYDEAVARRSGVITDEHVAEIGGLVLNSLKCRTFFHKDRYRFLREEIKRHLENNMGSFSSPGWVSAIHRYILLQLEIEEVRHDLTVALRESRAA